MKRNVLWNITYSLFVLLVLAGEGLAVASVLRLDMLPPLYLAALVLVLLLFAVLIAILLFGKKSTKRRQIIACVLAVLVVCGCAVITTVAMDVQDTLESTAANVDEAEETATREIYVMARNPVRELQETAGYTYGYVKDVDEDCSMQVLDAVRQQTGDQIHAIGYTNMATMVTALLNDRIDAMILSEAFVDILEEVEEFENFEMQAKLLAQVEVVEPEGGITLLPGVGTGEGEFEEFDDYEEPEEIPEETQSLEELDFTKLEPFVVYISGSDSRSRKVLSKGRADVNILAVVNPMTKQVLLLNTPRDYYVNNPAAGGGKDKLTHCGVYGINNSVKALATLYDVKVDYYIRVNFTGFENLIDAIGGITVNSDVAFTLYKDVGKIKVGDNELDGRKALAFARTRKGLKGGDNDRGKNQMKVITAVIKKATSGTTIISNYPDIIKSVEGMFKTTMPSELISALMKMQLSDMAQWNVVSYAATGYGDRAICASMPSMELSVQRPNQSSIKKAKLLIDIVKSSEILTDEVVSGIT